MAWFKRKIPLCGQVWFRSNLAPRAEEFAYLRELGFGLTPCNPAGDEQWAMKLAHGQWGEVKLSCAKEAPEAIPAVILNHDPRLTDEERETLRHCRSTVRLVMDTPTGHILRDRKHLLRIGNAVCGTDGVAVQDVVGWSFWSAAALQDELGHDADLDVSGIFIFHAVTEGSGDEQRCYWAHSHGLREVGKFDFDLIAPSDDALSTRTDFMRAVAFAVLEDGVALDGEAVEIVLGKTPIRFVSARRFLQSARGPAVDAYRNSVDESHLDQHGIACDAQRSGFLARMLGRAGQVTPSGLVSDAFPDDGLTSYSTTATDLMADRARKTLTVFAQWQEEFAEFEPKCIAKLRFPTGGGGNEYPWFEVHGLSNGRIDATCINDPYAIPNLKNGQRGEYPAEQLVDWRVILPFTSLHPAALPMARRLREKMPELRKVMAELKERFPQR